MDVFRFFLNGGGLLDLTNWAPILNLAKLIYYFMFSGAYMSVKDLL